VIEGDAVRDVLSYVHYDLARLFGEVRRECEKAVVNKQMTVAESQGLLKAYEAGLSGYTYLETESR
jgi:arginine decarboxylase